MSLIDQLKKQFSKISSLAKTRLAVTTWRGGSQTLQMVLAPEHGHQQSSQVKYHLSHRVKDGEKVVKEEESLEKKTPPERRTVLREKTRKRKL